MSSAAACAVPPGLGETEAPHFPISHRVAWPDAANATAWVPLHLVGAGIDLDTKTAAVTARAPQSMVQDYLNREDHALWAILSNGHQLRLLRDASSLTRQSFVEFDLDAIFTDQLYADFRLLFLTVHASRFAPRLDDKAAKAAADSEDSGEDAEVEQAEPKLDNCWLERWRTTAIDDGARALLNLQHGIAAALQELGTGFVSHPANAALRETLAAATDADRDLQRALLRIAYRLIVLFVAEDRDLLHRSERPRKRPQPVCRLLLHRTAAPAGGRADRRLAHRPVGGAPDRHRRPRRRRAARTRAERARRQPLFAGRAGHPRRRRAAQPSLARRGAGAVADRRPGHRAARARSTTATSTARNSAACTKDCSPTRRATTPTSGPSPSTWPPATTARSPAPTTRPPN